MNDMGLAEEIEQVILAGNKVGIPLASIIKMGFTSQQWNEIIAALRRRHERQPSDEMVVPRELINRAVLWFRTLAENGMDATFSDGERTPNAIAMDDIAAQFSMLSAAEAEVRKPCPLCGRTDPHSHTSGPLGMS